MAFPLPYSTPASHTCLSYNHATPSQLRYLLDGIQFELQAYFPHLTAADWVMALARVRPVLWLAPGVVTMPWDDLRRVVQVVAAIPLASSPNAPGYCPQALYLARCAAKDVALGHRALAEVEAAPLSYGPHAYQLITQLAAGNSVAQEILQVAAWQLQDFIVPETGDTALAFTPALAAPNLGARLYQLEQTRSPQSTPPLPPTLDEANASPAPPNSAAW